MSLGLRNERPSLRELLDAVSCLLLSLESVQVLPFLSDLIKVRVTKGELS